MNIDWYVTLAIALGIAAAIEWWSTIAVAVSIISFIIFKFLTKRNSQNKPDHMSDYYDDLSKPRSPTQTPNDFH